jgi:hypothetical protein
MSCIWTCSLSVPFSSLRIRSENGYPSSPCTNEQVVWEHHVSGRDVEK